MKLPLFYTFGLLVMILASACRHTEAIGPVETGKIYSVSNPGYRWHLSVAGVERNIDGAILIEVIELQLPSWAKVRLVDVENAPFWINLADVNSISKSDFDSVQNPIILTIPTNSTVKVLPMKVVIE